MKTIKYLPMLVFFCVMLFSAPVSGCKDRQSSGLQNNVTPVTLCQGGMLTILPLIARQQGFDAKEGLAITLINKKDGKLSMEALVAGECDFSSTSEPPIVSRSFEYDDFVILASLASSENATKIIARRDRGIRTAADLKGQIVGVRKNTISHFFFDMFLRKNGLAAREVKMRFIEPLNMPEALARGEIEAYSGSDASILSGKKLLGRNAVILSEPGLCYNANYLLGMKTYVDGNPDIVRRLLAALLRAERFTIENPAKVAALVIKAANGNQAELESILKDSRFAVSLPQAALIALGDHARWTIEIRQTSRTSIPNYLTFIRREFLQSLKPDAVTM
ncbi:MAG: ABC transporter substrate-binding protein [Nitrospirae bacterium]|nr:ABC transporter substrate-binding protein [Nitrospirota bacterium]